MTFLKNFFESIAFQADPPGAYGPFHLVLIFVILPLCIFLAWLCRKFDERKNKILLLSLIGFLILTEVFKQLFYFYVVEGGAAYHWSELPFQLCSLPMYLCPIAVFLKPGAARNAIYTFMTTFNFLGGFAAVFEPSGVFLSYPVLTAHAIFWHFTLVFLGFYFVFSKRGSIEWKDFRGAVLVFLIGCWVAFVINVLVGITADASINMFFVGPQNSPLIVFSTISEKFGWVASTVGYIPVVCLGSAAIFMVIRLASGRHKKIDSTISKI